MNPFDRGGSGQNLSDVAMTAEERAVRTAQASAGMVDITADRYPMPYLTPMGIAAMKGETPIRVLPPHDDVGTRGKKGSKKAQAASAKAKREPPPNMDPELFERLREARMEMAKEKGDKRMIEWGSQIRSYVLQPYTQAKDHRTDLALNEVHKVLDGALTPFIRAYLERFGGGRE